MACLRAGVSGVGFKILLDLFATSPRPLRHHSRPALPVPQPPGRESKLDTNVAWGTSSCSWTSSQGGVVPIRFIAFSLVGGLGPGSTLIVPDRALRGAGDLPVGTGGRDDGRDDEQLRAQQRAHLPRPDRLRGWAFVRGWISFVLACSVARALANVGIADHLFLRENFGSGRRSPGRRRRGVELRRHGGLCGRRPRARKRDERERPLKYAPSPPTRDIAAMPFFWKPYKSDVTPFIEGIEGQEADAPRPSNAGAARCSGTGRRP